MRNIKGFDELFKDELDAYMIRADGSDPDFFYLTGFDVPDPVVYLRKEDKDYLLVSPLEVSRAREEAEVDEVISTSKYREGDSREKVGVLSDIFRQFFDEVEVQSIGVPGDFPLKLADQLRDLDFDIRPAESPVKNARKTKTDGEIKKLKESQRATEEAMKKAKNIIKDSNQEGGFLKRNGEKLTSEKVKQEIKKYLNSKGCEVPEESIVACGEDSSQPHNTGEGFLKPDEPIIIDVFPKKNRYFGDMTRTIVKGHINEEVREMYQAVKEAKEEALKEIEDGVKVSKIHQRASEVLESHGFATLNSDPDTEEGFIHSTGHSVGLELHEGPRLADGDDILKENMVLTVEPGLYIKDIGGIRIEDMIRVTENGYENFNSMEESL